jgi:hypothetical protein
LLDTGGVWYGKGKNGASVGAHRGLMRKMTTTFFIMKKQTPFFGGCCKRVEVTFSSIKLNLITDFGQTVICMDNRLKIIPNIRATALDKL